MNTKLNGASQEREESMSKDKSSVHSGDLLAARLAELKRAVDFYDRVTTGTDAERIAVGTDHYIRLIDAARDVVAANKALSDSAH